jgi:hypothetical protein
MKNPIATYQQSAKIGDHKIWNCLITKIVVGPSGSRELLPAPSPLRTVHDSFPSHGSSISKANPYQDDPAVILTLSITAFAIRI